MPDLPSGKAPPDPLRGFMLRGSAWMIGMRFGFRAVGLVNTVVLARLLVPADFGVVAMGMVVVGLVEVFGHTGVDLALIRNPEAKREHYDTAFTIQILQGLLLTSILFLVAPLAGQYFAEPRLTAVIRLLGLRAVMQGLTNIGVVDFRKDLRFDREFRYGMTRRVVEFAGTLTLALVLRNYWALVIGMLLGQAATVALSYAFHPYRPRLCVARIRELWGFSQWMLVDNVGRYLNLKTDEVVVGGTSGTASMGKYFMASEVSTIPTNEFVLPVGRAVYPAWARMKDDPERLRAAFLGFLGSIGAVFFAVGFGLSAVARDAVAVLLGPQWPAVVPLMEWLAVGAALAGFSFGLQPFFVVLGRPRLFAALSWAQLAVLAPALALAASHGGVDGVARARTLVSGAFVPVLFYFVTRVSAVRPGDFPRVLGRPLLAAVAMSFAARGIERAGIGPPGLSLLAAVAAGAATFAAVLLVLWSFAGRPAGVEATVLEFAGRLRRRLSGVALDERGPGEEPQRGEGSEEPGVDGREGGEEPPPDRTRGG